MRDDILAQVQKPGRYIGREWNVSKKDFTRAAVKFALAFADLYEVGMSNLGLRIIYGLLNSEPDVACERFFAPGIDLEKLLRQNKVPVLSLESQRPLAEFDLVGFSLGHELAYTNVLNLLDLGGVPLEASLRGGDSPLVIGGGPCTLNPEPLADFFDLFIIGEAEEAVLEVTRAFSRIKDEFKTGKTSKEEVLILLARIPGVYVPSLYEVNYSQQGKIAQFRPRVSAAPAIIKKRFLKDLNGAYFPQEWLVPYIQIVHDRITLEIMRGCPNTCRFCQARSQYFPFRIRKPQEIIVLAQGCYDRSGYEEIALGGLSVSDYPSIAELTSNLIRIFKDKGISISYPSLKPTEALGELSSLLASIKKTGLTFAPEAASEKLRRILGKDFQVQEFTRTLERAYQSGYQHVKLYFMIGLPQEEWADLDAILEFSLKASELKRKIARGAAQVNLSVNTLIPKPHTPLQWFKMLDLDQIRQRQGYLRDKARSLRRLKLSFHRPEMSFLEGVFSRGDRRLSGVIKRAFLKGARFDAWDDYFNFALWLEAFAEGGLDPNFYLAERSVEEILPWDFIDTGISKDSLLREFAKIENSSTGLPA